MNNDAVKYRVAICIIQDHPGFEDDMFCPVLFLYGKQFIPYFHFCPVVPAPSVL